MYKVSVPIKNINVKRNKRELLLTELKRFDAKRVFLALGCYELDQEKRKRELSELYDNCQFFKKHDLEVGAWVWTFWIKNNTDFKCMRSINGTQITEYMCPSDSDFVEFAREYITDIAKCGVDIIQFDDDFRYGFLSDSPACLCDNHIKAINDIAGTSYTLEQIREHIITGEKNTIRDAYLKANGDFFRSFAKQMREAVNNVNPNIRLGSCACMSSWDIDGTEARELAYILAGDTKPFVRLIGAPYWAVKGSWGNSLQDVIELERMESGWTDDGHIEIMAEGDAYPRPRSNCPASYLEGFDTAIRASGCTSGILKYGIDYYSNADYETGYAKLHEKNREIYEKIEWIFGNKSSVGVRVYESMKKLSDTVTPTAVNKSVNIQDLFFSKASRALAYNTIPTTYSGEGICGIAFDENARNLPLSALNNGLILDIAAAEILTKRGIDVGINKIGSSIQGEIEHFVNDNNHILANGAISYEIELKQNAEALSYIYADNKTIPFSYRYENKDGNRFFVLNVNTRNENDSILKNYARGKQFSEIIPWLSGNKLPAYSYGHPALYIQCKAKENSMAVGLWNFFADTVFTPTVHLDKKYSHIEGVNCEAYLDGTDVIFSTDIEPFGFAFFEVKI